MSIELPNPQHPAYQSLLTRCQSFQATLTANLTGTINPDTVAAALLSAAINSFAKRHGKGEVAALLLDFAETLTTALRQATRAKRLIAPHPLTPSLAAAFL